MAENEIDLSHELKIQVPSDQDDGDKTVNQHCCTCPLIRRNNNDLNLSECINSAMGGQQYLAKYCVPRSSNANFGQNSELSLRTLSIVLAPASTTLLLAFFTLSRKLILSVVVGIEILSMLS